MSQDQQQHFPPEEFVLVEAILRIWEGKYWIAFVTIISLAVGTAYIYYAPNPVRASIKILSLPFSDTLRFASLNREFKKLNPENPIEVGPETLKRDFDIELSRGTVFRQAVINAGIVDNSTAQSETEISELAVEAARKFEISTAKLNKEGVIVSPSAVSFTGKNEALARKGLEAAILLNEEVVKNATRGAIQIMLEDLLQTRQLLLRENDQKRINAIAIYEKNTAKRIAFLQEQLNIARKLNIKNYTLMAQETSETGATSIANISKDTPYYLLGYQTIEKEIELVKQRTDKLEFAAGLIEVAKERRAIEGDNTPERLAAAMQMADFDSESYRSTHYNFNEISVKSTKIAWFFVLALAGLFGAAIGTFGYLFWQDLRKFIQRERNEA